MEITGDLLTYLLIATVVSIVWLLIVTILFFLFRQKINKLISFKNEDQILARLTQNMQKVEVAEEKIQQFQRHLTEFAQYQKESFSRMGLVRFNPYGDTGSDQSFAFALLNDRSDGVVFSSLHARDRTRLYIKPIQNGNAVGYELSTEENEALLIALNGGTT